MPLRKEKLTKKTSLKIFSNTYWTVHPGLLKRGQGRPAKTDHLFRVIGEKLPVASFSAVKKDMKGKNRTLQGIYIAHDSMGCPRYIGRGNIFQRLEARISAQPHEIAYFSFYVVSEKKHEREIETLLIRAAGFLLEFNTRKKRVSISSGSIQDYEAGTHFYERHHKKGR